MKYSHFPSENIHRKLFLANKKKSREEELWKMLGISKRTIILGKKLITKKILPIKPRPKSGRFNSLESNTNTLPIKTIFFDVKTFKEEFKNPKISKKPNSHLLAGFCSSQNVTKKNLHFEIPVKNPCEVYKSSQKNFNKIAKIKHRRNQSQQAFLYDEYSTKYNNSSTVRFMLDKETEEGTLRKKVDSKLNRKNFRKQVNLSAWENENEH
ncbi:hypothetical protein SteCoe_30234 [Stentor coeruleus]|uniref:Uncharacterized protein n=1 Tax=Stentor coeruleus TaxID=5963 RepID=A0A1R2B445_9CILI|nr:hypothetical protein SteCoe_30234 [Stentor coeruleus]